MSECGRIESSSPGSVAALRKTLETQRTMAAELIASVAPPSRAGDSVSISEEALRLLAAEIQAPPMDGAAP